MGEGSQKNTLGAGRQSLHHVNAVDEERDGPRTGEVLMTGKAKWGSFAHLNLA